MYSNVVTICSTGPFWKISHLQRLCLFPVLVFRFSWVDCSLNFVTDIPCFSFLRDIQDRSIIKIYRKEPIYSSFPAPHITNGDVRVSGKDRWSDCCHRLWLGLGWGLEVGGSNCSQPRSMCVLVWNGSCACAWLSYVFMSCEVYVCV